MRRIHDRHQSGFTIIELMIVVGIIGLISAVAIPSFIRYQARARFSESFSNIRAISVAQESFFVSNGSYFFTTNSWPGGGLSKDKRDSSIMDEKFGELGWLPEGGVYFDYEVATGNAGSTSSCGSGANVDLAYTVTAYGNTDGTGGIGIVKSVHPGGDTNLANNTCTAILALAGQADTPVVDGVTVYNQPARVLGNNVY